MKHRGVLIIVGFVFAIAWLLVIVGPGLTVGHNFNENNNWSRYEKNKKVIIGLDDTFVPMGFRNKQGQIVGYDIDLAKAVFKQYGITPVFQPIDWSMKETELRNGTIDMIWNGYSMTPARKKIVAFSAPYLANGQVLVTLKKNHINSFTDMRGKVLGVQSSSSGQSALDEHPKVLKNLIANKQPVIYDTFMNAINDLKAGRIQGVLIDRVYAGYYVANEPNPNMYHVVAGDFPGDQFAVGMRKSDTTLQTKVNQAFAKMQQDGQLAQITRKWFGTNPTTK
ncbi:amino acid ABC transporter substrate-binding protein [Periweissella cryptocerci]|uniref:Amino acid ABC transporter substrate-binding protein n=1 Tax=Periweissella cryptocerci TaxID=2506420 RepID=A0A4P6YS30_9LACO|nr:amino acid ABC transporter substrate-binding protein [Periweissella cryptocerci]QBO35479.1 amino acid ABC transporter substrate-binding protein [Periweissella cryptocerci]